MSCGSLRAVANNTSFALHVNYGTEQLHPCVYRDFCPVSVAAAEGLAMASPTSLAYVLLMHMLR
jgi:hypothetical protein